MNKQRKDVLNILYRHSVTNQREISELSGHSLGVVNKSIKELMNQGYINEKCSVTTKALKEFKEKAPKNAVILAAGYGMRMVPINTETPKGLLEVNGEVLIERIIRQLHEVGIYEIYVVVGFMKERYEYLIDDFGVELVVNEEYTTKNNLYSVKMVLNHLSNTYIIPCDIWCDKNPYHHHELYSWYMVSDLIDDESTVRVNRKMELVTIPKATGGNAMIGISYLLDNDAQIVKGRIEKLCNNPANDGSFWETALSVSADDIVDITVLKKGMTNRSFLFTCNGKKYIMRIPGEGTDQLINRRNEAMVYRTIDGRHICDDIAYINPDNGYKITEFLENARVCDPENYDDVCKCMRRLREFHELKLTVNHEFDIFGQLEFYESLWNGSPSAYRHYTQTKENVLSLRPYIEAHVGEKVLTHIDAVPDNFCLLILKMEVKI